MGIDFFHTKASDYLLIVDYFSRYIEVEGMNKGKRAPDVISALKDVFARHGIREEIRSDNGPPFDSSEFRHFAKEWDIQLKVEVSTKVRKLLIDLHGWNDRVIR